MTRTRKMENFLKLVQVIFLQILLSCRTVLPSKDDYDIVTRPLLFEESIFFELVDPEEISYTYKIRPAKDFGTLLNRTLHQVRLVPAEPRHACTPIENSLYVRDAIAFIERGSCSFVSKAIMAEQTGAIATVIYDYDQENDGHMIDMIQDETQRVTHIPSYFLLGKDGHMIIRTLERLQLRDAIINIPINVTGTPTNQPPWTLW